MSNHSDARVKSPGKLTFGIDGANLRRGGGITHLVELLRAVEPEKLGIERVIVWGGFLTLNALEDRPWLEKRNPSALDKGLLLRSLWQLFCLSKAARADGCDVLFVPGGNYAGNFRPFVTMSRNLLPFEFNQLARYGWSWLALKMVLLRLTQSQSYRRADGLIFLTEYARRVVLDVTDNIRGQSRIIPHGLNPRFMQKPKLQKPISHFDYTTPFRILYVSIIDHYKNQDVVIEAISDLRKDGLPIVLDLVGPFYPSALKRLNRAIARFDPDRTWVLYHGAVPFGELHMRYAQADLGLFASSCENMPNILLETMASGLPVACSNRGPMPEILGSAGVYFDPDEPHDVLRALRELLDSPQLRTELSRASYERAQHFSWQRCADETFKFLVSVVSR